MVVYCSYDEIDVNNDCAVTMSELGDYIVNLKPLDESQAYAYIKRCANITHTHTQTDLFAPWYIVIICLLSRLLCLVAIWLRIKRDIAQRTLQLAMVVVNYE